MESGLRQKINLKMDRKKIAASYRSFYLTTLVPGAIALLVAVVFTLQKTASAYEAGNRQIYSLTLAIAIVFLALCLILWFSVGLVGKFTFSGIARLRPGSQVFLARRNDSLAKDLVELLGGSPRLPYFIPVSLDKENLTFWRSGLRPQPILTLPSRQINEFRLGSVAFDGKWTFPALVIVLFSPSGEIRLLCTKGPWNFIYPSGIRQVEYLAGKLTDLLGSYQPPQNS